MIITREHNGEIIQIELTNDEMVRAYYEKQLIFDMEDMEFYIKYYEDKPESFVDEFGVTITEALKNHSLEEMARMMRKYIEEYGMSWDYARGEALEDWCTEKREIDPTCLDSISK